ncbi:MFS transporter [Umezawaea endophytica]|uniref:MFS transporter n=1 Tax=Umezawaea endophytica TaxID=1654476 RepID=A0A9X2VPJ7_9PSEU|nr:MFS transporter [Umezawaea endophytica]MCS7480341.1 MFS transporter [Umezawaea endophytica]
MTTPDAPTTRRTRRGVNSRLAALAVGAGLSEFGDVLFLVAFTAGLYVSTGSARTVGFVLVAFSIGNLVGAVLGGTLIDRLPARAWLVLGNLVTAALVVVFAYATALPAVAALSLVVGLSGRALLVGQQACVPLAEPVALLRANAVVMSSRRLGQLAGPFLGGTMVALGHTREAYLINAATFVLSAAATFAALPAHSRVHGRRADDESGTAPATGILAYARRTPAVRTSFLVQCVIGIIVGTGNTLVVVYATEILHAGPRGYGIINTFTAVGAILGGFTVGLLGRRVSAKWSTVLCLAVIGLAMGLLPTVPWLALAAILRAAGGWAWNILNIILMTNLHEGAPPHLHGRVIGFTRSGQDICIIVFTALAGTTATLVGTTGVLLTAGALGVASAVLLALTRNPFNWRST